MRFMRRTAKCSGMGYTRYKDTLEELQIQHILDRISIYKVNGIQNVDRMQMNRLFKY
jgi:hypothetical protein